jgi:PKD repeat protein
MRLYFMPEDHIFGQWDMHESLPAGYWHYYYQAYLPPSPYAPGILYPSAAGLSNKNVVELHVYTTPEKPWTLELDGTRIGGISYTVDKAFFESALACQQGANHEATYTDSSGNVWVGMPLWFLAGFVDDADQHSSNAYNDAKALAGYEIVVIGSGSYTKVFPSAPTVRSDAFIVANTKSGAHIPDTDTKNWPLKLVGTGVASSGKLQVGGINTIILNYPPVPETITVPSPVDVGSMVAAGGTFSDPYDAIGHTVTWDWGDGSPATPGTVDEAANSVSGSHVYTALGTYNVKFTITDQPGSGKTSSEATVVVQNVLPIVISVAVPTTPVLTGTPITASATFTDVLDTHTATWAWGDGSTSTGVVDETAMAVTGSHTYTVPGLLTVTLTLTDGSGATATKSSQYMIVYDPKSGFVTGLGSIASPAGAYAANPSLTGPATIELLARYPVVMNKPFTGVTAFQFLKAKMSFVSTSYDWLVIQKDAKKAFYKGSGQIGGKGDYGFLAAVIDGGSKPAQDKFRIKIWDKATGNVVYDTQPGAADTADPTTPLTLGGLVVDKLLG